MNSQTIMLLARVNPVARHVPSTLVACAAAAICALTVASATAQDVTKVAPGSSKVLVDNAYVRVVEGRIPPGAVEPVHVHPAGWYYVTQGGTLDVKFTDGRTQEWSPKTGESGWAEAEGPHVSRNTGKTTLVWTLVELKQAAATVAQRH